MYEWPNISEDGRSLIDVKTRIAHAKDASNKRNELLTKVLSRILTKSILLITIITFFKCYLLSVNKSVKFQSFKRSFIIVYTCTTQSRASTVFASNTSCDLDNIFKHGFLKL